TSALGRRPGHVDETSDPDEMRFLRSVRYVTELADEPVNADLTENADKLVADERPQRKKRVAESTPEPEETDEWLSASAAD
ncbi:MAG: hypothetical protein ACRDBH_11185, partial [Bosea sp. (in: a-proteobacteria)]